MPDLDMFTKEQLVVAIETLTEEKDELIEENIELEERLAAVRPVVEAARAWFEVSRPDSAGTWVDLGLTEQALLDAVRAYQALDPQRGGSDAR